MSRLRFAALDMTDSSGLATAVRGERPSMAARSRRCYNSHGEVDDMQLEDYFDFLAPNDIRVKGTRVGIETILYDYIHRSRTPEDIVEQYPSLTLEQVHATLTYYLHNKAGVTAYLADWLENANRRWEEQNRNPSPAIQKLRRIAAERQGTSTPKP
jgi:uncharacterized protein (DUF433 family)